MENVTINDAIFVKKSDGYSFEKDDFVATGEITVTITLSEYRYLIKTNAVAKSKIDEAVGQKWEAQRERDALKEKVNQLMSELMELKNGVKDSEEKEE